MQMCLSFTFLAYIRSILCPGATTVFIWEMLAYFRLLWTVHEDLEGRFKYKKVFYNKGSVSLAQVAWRSGGCPILADTPGQVARGAELLMEL